MAYLPTNYLDDILAQSMNGKRKFRITRPDGTFEEVVIEDISEYSQTGSTFGAGDINRTNQAVNEKFDSEDVVDPMLTTEPGFAADAYKTKLQFDEQNKNFEWKLHADRVAGGNTITLPTEWKELLVYCHDTTSVYTTCHHILKPYFDTFEIGMLNLASGYYYSTQESSTLNFIIKQGANAISSNFTLVGGNNNTNGLVTVYYK